MILWNDFILDDQFGPLLAQIEKMAYPSRRTRLDSRSIMEDAKESIIQETSQEQRPARMVGFSSLESNNPHGKEANWDFQTASDWQRGNG